MTALCSLLYHVYICIYSTISHLRSLLVFAPTGATERKDSRYIAVCYVLPLGVLDLISTEQDNSERNEVDEHSKPSVSVFFVS